MRSTTQVLIALIVGLAAGIGVAGSGNPTLLAIARGIEPIGTMWINGVRMTVIPLVVALILTSVAASGDPRRIGRIGMRALPIFLGLLLAGGLFTLLVSPLSLNHLVIAPEVAESLRAGAAETTRATSEAAKQMPSLVQRIVDIVPVNPFKAAADGAMLPLIVFTLILGVAVTRLDPERQKPLVAWFQAVADAMLIVVGWVLALAPAGIFALAVTLGAKMGLAAAEALIRYVITLSLLLLVFTLALYPLVAMVARVPIGRFAAAAAPAQVVAFSTRSSLAALPAMISAARERLGYPPSISGFALSLAVSVFRLNVPIAWVVGVLFLGKLYGVELDLATMLGLIVTATLISFSVPGIPSSSLFLLAPVLVDLGLPAEGAGILIAVDAIPDMFKTTINVTSHLSAAAILAHREPTADETDRADKADKADVTARA